MNARKLSHYPLFGLVTAVFLLLTACQPGAVATSPQPTATAAPEIQATQTPVPPTQPSGETTAGITLDYTAMAQDMTLETLTDQPAGSDGLFLDAAPEYRRIILQGYPVTDHRFKPQVFIFPAGDLTSENGNAVKIAADLQALLQTQQDGEQLPFLPVVFSSRQAIDAQVQYLDFKSGKGVRYLTQFNNGLSPINNYALVYTFQGLTSDGKYYVSAVLPLTSSELSDAQSFSEQEAKVGQAYFDYLSQTVTLLNKQPTGGFTPDLSKLDALVRSIEVR